MVAYLGTVERSYQMIAGSVIGIASMRTDLTLYGAKAGTILTLCATLGFVVLGLPIDFTSTQVGALSCFLTSILLLGIEIHPAGLLSQCFGHPFMKQLGALSFGVYLWHFPSP